MKHYVVYSHGFGVRKDDRGLMTDIVAALPGSKHVLFDYNEFDEATNTMTVTPIDKQVEKLKTILDALPQEATIDLIAHSQGCAVVALLKPQKVRKCIFIAPPENLDTQKIVNFFGGRESALIDLKGESRIPRRDGTTTVVPAEYWGSIDNPDLTAQYGDFSRMVELVFYIANNDEVLGRTTFEELATGISVVCLHGNHDFTGAYRQDLLEHITSNLMS
jgi:pimeloyl-ACP methyl ester carboxylesterase